MSTFCSHGPGQSEGVRSQQARSRDERASRSWRGTPMKILKRASNALVVSAALARVLGLGIGSAAAVTATWTVKPGGAITAKAGVTTLKDTKTGSVLTCQSSSGKNTVKSGSGLSGTGIGSITA